MNFSKFILSMSVASLFFLGACSDTTDSVTMVDDPLADEEVVGEDDSDSEDVEKDDSKASAKSSSSVKAKSSSSAKVASSDAKAKSSSSVKAEEAKGDNSSASTKEDDSKGDEAKSSSSSVKKRIPGMDDTPAGDNAKSSSSSSAVVVSSDAKNDGKDDCKVSSSSVKEETLPSSDSKPVVSSSSESGFGNGSETTVIDDTTSIGTDNMDTVSSSESHYLDSLKQELEDDTTDDPENFDILDSGNINFGNIDTNNVYFCFTGDDEWLRINFEDMAKAGLPFLRNGHAWGLRKKYLVRFEEACEAVYVMRKDR